jgi:hypothetical protein
VGPRAGLDGCGKLLRHRGSIPGPPGPQRDAIQTELSRSIHYQVAAVNYICHHNLFGVSVLTIIGRNLYHLELTLIPSSCDAVDGSCVQCFKCLMCLLRPQ